jgi:bifunctional DNA-binding transcriptional regulator/antitoxin component of YhaV-PrlF toxin-antitoxin module
MFGIRSGDELEIAVDGGSILLRKLERRCVFCNGVDDLREFRGKQLCQACGDGLRSGQPQGDLVDPPLGDTELGSHSGES